MAFFDELDADLNNAFFDDFASDVLLVAAGVTIRGIFDDPSQSGKLAADRHAFAPVRTHLGVPTLLLMEGDVQAYAITKDLRLNVKGLEYRVAEPPLKDGAGLCEVALLEASATTTEKSWQQP